MQKKYKSKFYKFPIEVSDIGWEKLVIITDNQKRESIYSWYDVVEKNSQSFYINKCLLWWFIKKIPKSVLIIWFWAGSFWKYLEDHIQEINITWIEIDKTMIDIAKNEFWIKTKDLYISETNLALEKIIKLHKQFDLILIDVYWNDWEIPDYFSKEIFFIKLQKILKSNWTISINYSNYNIEFKNRLEKYKTIHSNFLKYFSKFHSFIYEEKKDNWNKVWIYNLDKKYLKDDFEKNYLSHTKNWFIKHDKNLYKNFKTKKD